MSDELAAAPIQSKMDASEQSLLHPRHDQLFPSLTETEIQAIRRFGTDRHFGDGELLLTTGQPGPGMFVVLSGHVAITQRDGFGNVRAIADQHAGQFIAEIGQLSGRVALVDGRAEGDVHVILIPPDRLRALMVEEAMLGERIMRALILRRVNLLQGDVGGPILIGGPEDPDVIRMDSFLTRNGYPHHLLDPGVDKDAADLVGRYAASPGISPLVLLTDGTVLRNPSINGLATALRMMGHIEKKEIHDVAIVGCGPAGLSTAVYGASEGLSVVVCDSRAFGGQAGASARIENYFGFPTGISGMALTARAFNQAQKFGAQIMIPATVKSVDCSRRNGSFALEFENGDVLKARSVVVASGAMYRRPDIARLAEFEGRGVWYWASPVEAKLCSGQDVVLVGGGNSAGQAAVFLSSIARQVHMVIRGNGLSASMSRYLIERIDATPNILKRFNAEVAALEGTQEGGLQHVRIRNNLSNEESVADTRNLFLFAGAEPATDWLKDCGITLDRAGFVITGIPRKGAAVQGLETSVPGIFAIGDVRAGSVKRVGGAIGEGAQVVAALHAFLGDTTAAVA
jgi:thioredoxin reductase (NADPH)